MKSINISFTTNPLIFLILFFPFCQTKGKKVDQKTTAFDTIDYPHNKLVRFNFSKSAELIDTSIFEERSTDIPQINLPREILTEYSKDTLEGSAYILLLVSPDCRLRDVIIDDLKISVRLRSHAGRIVYTNGIRPDYPAALKPDSSEYITYLIRDEIRKYMFRHLEIKPISHASIAEPTWFLYDVYLFRHPF
jgi:hypothetical protein